MLNTIYRVLKNIVIFHVSRTVWWSCCCSLTWNAATKIPKTRAGLPTIPCFFLFFFLCKKTLVHNFVLSQGHQAATSNSTHIHKHTHKRTYGQNKTKHYTHTQYVHENTNTHSLSQYFDNCTFAPGTTAPLHETF